MVSFCAWVSSLCADLGGITVAPVEKMRATISLRSGSPGTIGTRPERVGLVASSLISRRMSARRAFLSGPWQRKHVSDMMGRMSRLKLVRSDSAAPAAVMAASEPATVHRNPRIMSTLIHPAARADALFSAVYNRSALDSPEPD